MEDGKGMQVGDLSARLAFDDRDFEAGVRSAKKSMLDITKVAETATKRIEKDFDGVSKELKKMFSDVDADKLTRELKQGGEAAKQAARKIEAALNGIEDETVRARRGAALFGNEWKDAAQKAERALDGVEDQLEDIQRDADKAASGFKGLNLGALVGAGSIGGGMAVVDSSRASRGHLQAQLGVDKATAAEMNEIAKSLYRNNAGESMRDVSDGVALVNQGLGLTGARLQDATKDAFRLRDVYGTDLRESINAARTMSIGFGMDAGKAFDIMTWGMQNGLNLSNDLIDTLIEYPSYFTQIGLTADDMLNYLNIGMKNGVYNTDYLADAIKEMGIRIRTEGDKGQEVINALFSPSKASSLINAFKNGGEAGRKAFYTVMQELNKVEDANKRYTLGVDLLGTKFEDLTDLQMTNIIKELAATADQTLDVTDKTKELDAEYDNFASTAERLSRTLQVSVIGKLEGVGDVAMTAIDTVGSLGMGFLALKGAGVDVGGILDKLRLRQLPGLGGSLGRAGTAMNALRLGPIALLATAFTVTLGGAISWYIQKLRESHAETDAWFNNAQEKADAIAQATGNLPSAPGAGEDMLDYRLGLEGKETTSDDGMPIGYGSQSWAEYRKASGGSGGGIQLTPDELNEAILRSVEGYATGGIVPGPLGSPRLAVVHGGEEVLTPEQRRGGGITTINHTGTITVRGVTDANQLVGVARIIADDIQRNDRRLPNRVSLIPI